VQAEAEEQAAERGSEAVGSRNFLRMLRHFSACFTTRRDNTCRHLLKRNSRTRHSAFCYQAKTMHGLGFASKQVVVLLRECCRSTLESSEAPRWPTAGA
jgi:hypothetical protein